MRCINCGWNNNDTDTHCIKCRNPLQTSRAKNEPHSFPGTIAGKQAEAPLPNEHLIKEETKRPDGLSTEMTNCPSCGYLVSKRTQRCPRCGKEMVASAGTVVSSPRSAVSPGTVPSSVGPSSAPTVVSSQSQNPEIPKSQNSMASGAMTIDPYRQKAIPKKEVFLLRIDTVEEPPVLLSFETKGDSLELNRDNLDETNHTITGKVQAELNFEGDKWMIRDSSEQKTTFLQLADRHELKDGDILLIGNKRFVFYSKNPNA